MCTPPNTESYCRLENAMAIGRAHPSCSTCMISRLVGQIRGESPRLVHGLPHRSAAVVVVGEHFVVVRVQAGQQRTPRRAAYRGCAVGVPELGALVPEQFFRFLHVVQRTCVEYRFSKKKHMGHAGNTRRLNACNKCMYGL